MSIQRSAAAAELFGAYDMCSHCHQFRYVERTQGISLCRGCDEELTDRVGARVDPDTDNDGIGGKYSDRSTAIVVWPAPTTPQITHPHTSRGTVPTIPHRYSPGFATMRHVKLELRHPKGGQEEEDAKLMFHGAIRILLDKRDYPVDPFYKKDSVLYTCNKCNGFIYPSPLAFPARLRLLAHQLGLKLRITGWKRSTNCGEWTALQVPYSELEGKLL